MKGVMPPVRDGEPNGLGKGLGSGEGRRLGPWLLDAGLDAWLAPVLPAASGSRRKRGLPRPSPPFPPSPVVLLVMVVVALALPPPPLVLFRPLLVRGAKNVSSLALVTSWLGSLGRQSTTNAELFELLPRSAAAGVAIGAVAAEAAPPPPPFAATAARNCLSAREEGEFPPRFAEEKAEGARAPNLARAHPTVRLVRAKAAP